MTSPRPPADGDEERDATTPNGEHRADGEGRHEDSAELAGQDFSDVSLGQLLREVRQRRALSLGEVERDTRINRDYLEALEQERYELLPAPVYTRGFVRAYARHLGLDEEAALSLLPAELPSPPGLEPIASLRGGPRTFLPSVNPPVIAAVGIGLGLLAIVALSLALLSDDGAAPAASPAGAPAASTVTATAPSSSGAAGDATPAATVPPFELGETPNFIGVDSETAQALLTQLGLQFVVIEVDTSDAPKGSVFAQTPEPGSPIEANDDVTLIVSKRAGE